MHLLLRYYDPIEGAILLGGVEFAQLNFPSVHKRIGVVSQDTQMFNCSIGENITYGAGEDVSEAEIELAARAAQAWDFIQGFEDKVHTKVGERGQRLRIAIARCLLRKPKMLLLDEATSALDAESEAQVQKALDTMIWTGEKTVMLVAHRLSTVVNANKIVALDKGRAVEQGTHEELVARRGVYAS